MTPETHPWRDWPGGGTVANHDGPGGAAGSTEGLSGDGFTRDLAFIRFLIGIEDPCGGKQDQDLLREHLPLRQHALHVGPGGRAGANDRVVTRYGLMDRGGKAGTRRA